MGKQNSRGFLIKIGDGAGSEVFTAFAALTAKSLKIGNERVDVTTEGIDPTAAIWRETIDGTKSVSVSGDYTLVKEVPEARLMEVSMSKDAVANFEIVVPNVGTFSGAFSVEAEVSGDGAVKGSMTMESTGPVTFVAES
ncbi:phage major tail protein, TP901-1 family [Sedimentitalea sp. CY04]|uniref:Phage major tail protein, TP901-1 family n=1 Tax=Parasedimentitalea denitrificans TaxID=2211118 RepID=A0ABX0WDA7_9RHOB|nr:phage tail tube protein [Sedimentitalea sp. CY04]NIZ63287.1 phage major tail protein, TP901-1 family [Sedimentitalea sp. CY04]